MSGLTLSSIENGKLRTSAVVFHKIKHAFKRLGYEFEFATFIKNYDIYVPAVDEATVNGHIKYVRQYKIHKPKEFKTSVEDKEENKDLPDLEDSALFCNQFEKPFDNEKYCELEYPERIE